MKYRIWDKKEKKFIKNIAVDQYGDYVEFYIDEFEPDWSYLSEVEGTKYVTMLESGLKDIKGKDIFEGDLIKFKSEIVGDEFFDNRIGKVVFEEAAFWIDYSDVSIPLWSETRGYEVLGNIYENSELLPKSLR